MSPQAFEGFLDSQDIWCQIFERGSLQQSQQQRRPALFLDRDGVIVEEVLYLHRVPDVAVIPGAAVTIAQANRRGVPVVVISNQAGIGRGYYGWKDFQDVQQVIINSLDRLGAHVDAVLACPHHPSGVGSYAHPAHPDRKPQPGMLLRAAEALHIDLESSWVIGDKASDLLAGRAAGLRGGVLVLTGHGPAHRDAATALRTSEFEILFANSIGDVSMLIPLLA